MHPSPANKVTAVFSRIPRAIKTLFKRQKPTATNRHAELKTINAEMAPTAPEAGARRLFEAEAMEGAAYYLSLEFVHGGMTYWLCSCCRGICPHHFVAIPQKAFGGRNLNPGHLSWAGGNSEVYLTSDLGSGARFTSEADTPFEEVDLAPIEHIGWNRMCEVAHEQLAVRDWTGLYLQNQVRQKDSSLLKLADVAYVVTAFDTDDHVVAICGEDHDPPDNINRRAYEGLDTPATMRSLLSAFKVESICLGGRLVPVE